MKPVPDPILGGSSRACCRGSIVVELALTVPLLAFLFLTLADLGLLIREHQIIQTAVREGARFSALAENRVGLALDPAATKYRIKQRVIDYLDGFSITPDDITINQNYPMTTGGMVVVGSELVVTYNRTLLILGAPLLPAGGVNLTGRAVFRNFY